jgi:hypothetical protein
MSSNATLIIRFYRLFRGGRTAHNGLVGGGVWSAQRSKFGLHFTHNQLFYFGAKWIQFAAKLLISSQNDLTLNQRVQGSSPCAPTTQLIEMDSEFFERTFCWLMLLGFWFQRGSKTRARESAQP